MSYQQNQLNSQLKVGSLRRILLTEGMLDKVVLGKPWVSKGWVRVSRLGFGLGFTLSQAWRKQPEWKWQEGCMGCQRHWALPAVVSTCAREALITEQSAGPKLWPERQWADSGAQQLGPAGLRFSLCICPYLLDSGHPSSVCLHFGTDFPLPPCSSFLNVLLCKKALEDPWQNLNKVCRWDNSTVSVNFLILTTILWWMSLCLENTWSLHLACSQIYLPMSKWLLSNVRFKHSSPSYCSVQCWQWCVTLELC